MLILEKKYSKDGSIKYLWELDDNKTVESIYFTFNNEQYICISSQVGCNIKCPFCETGKQRNLRNLTSDEIYQQVSLTLCDLGYQNKSNHFYQVAIAGMGEPLQNFDNVTNAAHKLRNDLISQTVSVSTSGIVPAIRQLVNTDVRKLFISLHATTNEVRDELVPLNRRYPIQDVLAAARYYFDQVGTPVTATYLLFKDKNDSDDDLNRLMDLLDPNIFIVQLSEWNNITDREFVASPRLELFHTSLQSAGYNTFILKSMGRDINGGCGQLRSRFLNSQ